MERDDPGSSALPVAMIGRSGRWQRLLRTLLLVAVALVSLAGLTYIARHPILRGMAAALTHDDPLVRSDVIVVLSGDETTRPFHAARLYREGWAPSVAIPLEQLTPTARLGLARTATDIAIEVLQDSGVPADSIVILSRDRPVTSTRDEAGAIRKFVDENQIGSAIVVTSAFHTARARFTIGRELPDSVRIRMSAAPEWRYDSSRWWESEAGIADYGMEVLKWIHTLGVLN